MKPRKPTQKQRIAAQLAFRAQVDTELLAAGAVLQGKCKHHYYLETVRAGLMEVSTHEFDDDDSTVFSVYLRPALGRTSEEVKGVVVPALREYGGDINQFNAKWNIHEWHASDAIDELQDRLRFLMTPEGEEYKPITRIPIRTS